MKFEFYISDTAERRLVALKDFFAETYNKDYDNMTFNQFASEILEGALNTQYKKAKEKDPALYEKCYKENFD